ncbi:MAG: hypothetical protein ACO1N1_09250 [Dyadobacter fermentans]
MAEEKYVHIEGRVTIEPVIEPQTGDQALKLVFVDNNFEPERSADGQLLEPIYLYLNHEGQSRPVRFKHVSFVAEFVDTGFSRVDETLHKIDPFIGQWATFEDSDNDQRMNPSGPPK